MKVTLNILNFEQFYLVDAGPPTNSISLSLAGSIPLLKCTVIFMGGNKCVKCVKRVKCVLQINMGNNMKEKVKGSFVVELISVKSEFLDTVFTFQHSKHRCINYILIL